MKRIISHGAKALGRAGRTNNTANAALLGGGLGGRPNRSSDSSISAAPIFARFACCCGYRLGIALRRGRRFAIAGGYVTRDVPRGLESGGICA